MTSKKEQSDRFSLPPRSKFSYMREDLCFWWDDKWFKVRFWCANHERLFPFILGFAMGLLGNFIAGRLGFFR